MSGTVTVRRPGPAITVQDLGRPGWTARGLSRGGAADRRALFAAAALLGLDAPVAALEMAGFGAAFEVDVPTRFALTGAPMRAAIGGRSLGWAATHRLDPGETLTVGAVEAGSYGYLTFAGGLRTAPVMDSRSAHLAAGIGRVLRDGDRLPIGPDPAPGRDRAVLEGEAYFSGGTVRVMAGPQTGLFPPAERERFFAASYRKEARSNRQGARLAREGGGDGAPDGERDWAKGLASDFLVPGDIQVSGTGEPIVLLSECQTIGGYPRIGTVVAADLPVVAQAPAGARLGFRAVGEDEADRALAECAALAGALRARVRAAGGAGPASSSALLSAQLISGAVRGDEED